MPAHIAWLSFHFHAAAAWHGVSVACFACLLLPCFGCSPQPPPARLLLCNSSFSLISQLPPSQTCLNLACGTSAFLYFASYPDLFSFFVHAFWRFVPAYFYPAAFYPTPPYTMPLHTLPTLLSIPQQQNLGLLTFTCPAEPGKHGQGGKKNRADKLPCIWDPWDTAPVWARGGLLPQGHLSNGWIVLKRRFYYPTTILATILSF